MVGYIALAALLSYQSLHSVCDASTKSANGRIGKTKVVLSMQRIPLLDTKGRKVWFHAGKPAEALIDMMEYALSHGYEIRFNSAYRTYAHQKRLWLAMPDIAGDPDEGGVRTHQTGCAVDISGTIKKIDGVERKTILFWWLKRFGKKFHFYNTIPDEPWHWTYMGPIENELLKLN